MLRAYSVNLAAKLSSWDLPDAVTPTGYPDRCVRWAFISKRSTVMMAKRVSVQPFLKGNRIVTRPLLMKRAGQLNHRRSRRLIEDSMNYSKEPVLFLSP